MQVCSQCSLLDCTMCLLLDCCCGACNKHSNTDVHFDSDEAMVSMQVVLLYCNTAVQLAQARLFERFCNVQLQSTSGVHALYSP